MQGKIFLKTEKKFPKLPKSSRISLYNKISNNIKNKDDCNFGNNKYNLEKSKKIINKYNEIDNNYNNEI